MGFILSVDAGTTNIRAILFDHDGSVITSAQRPFTQFYPEPGWVEHDASEIWECCKDAIDEVLMGRHVDPSECVAIAITNQRETIVLWDCITGKPLNNALVWQDRRTELICDSLLDDGRDSEVFERTGLHIDPYFSATKIRWMIDNLPSINEAISSGRVMAGTIDSWLIWNLTGHRVHATDHSNASRTMLFNIHSREWDDHLLGMLDVPRSIMPEVRPTGCIFGYTDPDVIGVSIPIAASIGDQQAALFGQCCHSEGDVKVTFGTGGFLLMNTGRGPVRSVNGLLSTIAWTIDDEICYATEGSVYIAGAAVQWLRDELHIIEESSATEIMATSVPDTAGCVVVPAFTGLGAPHWEPGARGTIMGLTRGTNRNHLARAVLESMAFQTCDVLRAMSADSDRPIRTIRVDGGASENSFLCQFLADMTGARVLRPKVTESTALGAAYMAGITVGFWKDMGEVRNNWELDREFVPSMSEDERRSHLRQWERAVRCAKMWSCDSD